MTVVAIVSGACGSGKSTTLVRMRPLLGPRVGEVATIETDAVYMMIDPTFSIPWPEAGRYWEIAVRNTSKMVLEFAGQGFDWIAVGSNALHEPAVIADFVAPLQSAGLDVRHITLDPTLECVQERVAGRGGGPPDEKKTPEWLALHVAWMRERYGPWTSRIDNSDMTPDETVEAIYEAVLAGKGRLDEPARAPLA